MVYLSRLDELISTIKDKDSKALKELRFYFEDYVCTAHEFPQTMLNDILTVIGCPEFYDTKNLGKLFILFLPALGSTEYMTDDQKMELLNVIETNYGLYKHPYICFSSVEIIATLFPDERSLDVLRRLKKTVEVIPRSLVPHGFDWFVTSWPDSQFTDEAIKELREMLSDPEFAVRDEAEASLARLRRKGIIQ
jgi:hypothetical protein